MIAIVIGTKAELIKCMPLMLELQKQKRNYIFIHTGQHSLKDACEKFGVKTPDFVLSEAPKGGSKFWSKINKNSITWFFETIFRIRRVIRKINPLYVIYHGDTMSTAAAAIASSKLLNSGKRWKNVHLEAGLRSGSLMEPFPEEISRQISDFFSDILLAVSDLTEKNLRGYRDKKRIINVGNTIIDSAFISYSKAKKLKLKKQRGRYALINIHRHENLKDRERMERIVQIIEGIGIGVVWPIHENTKKILERYNLLKRLENSSKVSLSSLKDYPHFIFLLANCEYIITDGGSIQEESLIFEKPCIILRKKTERWEGLNTGINFLTKLDVNRTKTVIEGIESKRLKSKKIINPYGNKGVSKKILEILR